MKVRIQLEYSCYKIYEAEIPDEADLQEAAKEAQDRYNADAAKWHGVVAADYIKGDEGMKEVLTYRTNAAEWKYCEDDCEDDIDGTEPLSSAYFRVDVDGKVEDTPFYEHY